MDHETFFGEKLKKAGLIKQFFAPAPTYGEPKIQTLVKPDGRDLVILNITDNHFSDYDVRFFMGIAAAHTIRKVARTVKPDLITVTGDMVCGTAVNKSIKRFIKLMESFGVPWAPVYGNHDDETNCSLDYLTEQLTKAPHCLMKPGPEGMRTGNYIINIDNTHGETVQTLFMMDSAHSQPNEVQTEWFIKRATEINAKQTAVMLHIPLAQYQYAEDKYYDKAKGEWNPECCGCGENNEKICCERDKNGVPVDRGFFEKAKAVPSFTHVICGHEHMNDRSCVFDGIRLTYTLKVGQGSGHQPGFNGGTAFFVGDNGIYRMQHISRIKHRNRVIEDIRT